MTPCCHPPDPHLRRGTLARAARRNPGARLGQLYWHTREDNYRAHAMYDKYTPHSGFLRYVIRLMT